MTSYVLDASALLRYLDREPGFGRIAQLLKRATRGEAKLLVSAVNWGEVVSVLYRVHGAAGRLTASKLRALPLSIIAVDTDGADQAGVFKHNFKVPYADAFAGALALAERATLVTADFDFKAASRAVKTEFLPAKG